MLHRLIGGAVGAAVTFGLLWFNNADATAWATAAIVGAIVAFLWPVLIGGYFSSRSRSRRNNEIEAEVARRVAQQSSDIPPR
jgi:phosphate/sulfate permease